MASTHRSDSIVRNLAWRGIPQSRAPPALVDRGAPHRGHGGTAYLSASSGLLPSVRHSRGRSARGVRCLLGIVSGLDVCSRNDRAPRGSRGGRGAGDAWARAACGNTDSWVEAHPADGWSAQYGDAANSSYAPVDGAGDTATRLDPLGQGPGRVAGGARLGRLPRRQRPDRGRLLADGVGERQQGTPALVQPAVAGRRHRPARCSTASTTCTSDSRARSCRSRPTQWIRWRNPVIGLPQTPRLLSAGELLVVTHLGQVLVYDAHRGNVVGTALDLVEGVDPTDSQRGLADCQQGRSRCPVAAAPAFSAATGDRGDDAVAAGRRRPRGGRAALPAGPDAAAVEGLDQHGGRRRSARQPGAVGRRHTPSTSTDATGTCGR